MDEAAQRMEWPGVRPHSQIIARQLIYWNHFVKIYDVTNNFTLKAISEQDRSHAKTAIILNCECKTTQNLIFEASQFRYFNKTYQWLLWDFHNNNCFSHLQQSGLNYLGPNAQIVFLKYEEPHYLLWWDVHSKGRHLKANLEMHLVAKGTYINETLQFVTKNDINDIRGIRYRGDFEGLKLRGATVIDQDNITDNDQIEQILSRSSKDPGVSAFTKYHYELFNLLRHRLNFTVEFRNARGWAGHLDNSSYRLGFLGIMQRNEADIGASAAYPRLNRFAEFDSLHQGWKFHTAFLFLYTPDLHAQSKKGNFLAPFEKHVWLGSLIILNMVGLVWIVEERVKSYLSKITTSNVEVFKRIGGRFIIPLNIFAAICQQGVDPVPSGASSRVITLTSFLFSLVMYNYYTSSVVGGLLSSTDKGPSTVDEVISSPLRLSFEDIGYYKVKFRENKAPSIVKLLNKKVLPPRDPHDLPVYTNFSSAIPYLKKGGYAFHCEEVDVYPELAKILTDSEICDLRAVSGLLGSALMDWIVHKNSQYTEIFRHIVTQAQEVGLIQRLLRQRRPKKPPCQNLYTVYPVNLSGTLSAFVLLAGKQIP
ncbi:hypothetical protein GQX74_002484 [Glossina fuscipes]|nr:hypothetical protein GQX74_002484 [Glossina fuscipes]